MQGRGANVLNSRECNGDVLRDVMQDFTDARQDHERIIIPHYLLAKMWLCAGKGSWLSKPTLCMHRGRK